MKKPSEQELKHESLRQSIIGLGERSIRKSYYPELRKRIAELEETTQRLKDEINERQAAQEQATKLTDQLRQAQKMEAIGTLAGGIAHDFNNILSAIAGYTELAQLSLDSSCVNKSEMSTHLDRVMQASNRAGALVNQILTFSRQQNETREPLNLVTTICDVLALLRSSLPSSMKIEQRFPSSDCMVLANETQIHQIVVNLANNCAHAIGANTGTLAIELEKVELDISDLKIRNLKLAPGSYFLLKISDTGCGMSRTVLDRIFEPYFTTKPKGKGTGIGLAVVHGIVTSHGGIISAYSEPDKGSSFLIYLPEFAEKQIKSEQVAAVPIKGGNEKILVVEDEKLLAKLHDKLLKSLGYQVHVETDSEAALRLFTEKPDTFDLVLTDMTMPELNGAELAREMLRLQPSLPIILCTGFSELINEEKAKAIGIQGFIMKPLIRKKLALLIRHLLDKPTHT